MTFTNWTMTEAAEMLQFRRVLDQIRGRAYEEALMILEYMPYRACDDITQTLISVSCLFDFSRNFVYCKL